MAETPAEVYSDSTLSGLKKKLEQAKSAQSKYISIWEMNRAFYLGDQWVFWNRTRLERPKLDDNRVLAIDNRIQGIVRTEIAKMTKQRPTFQVVPNTGEQEDLDCSLTGERVLRYLWRHLDLREKLEEVLLWSRVCSCGFWKVCWDGTKGESFQVAATEDGKPLYDQETQKPYHPDEVRDDEGNLPEGLKARTVAVGDVHVEVVNPFEFFPDPVARSLDECEWCMQVSIKSAEYVRQMWGKELAPDSEVSPGPADIRIPSTQERGMAAKGVKLYEYWCRPTTKDPKGRKVVWAKDTILEEGDNPYDDLPFVMFRSVPVPGRFWPTSITEQLRPVQAELNKIRSQIIENAQRIGNPIMLKSRLANTEISGVPGEIAEFDDTTQNAQPTYLIPPSMPPYVIEQVERLERSLQEISGQHEVSNAQVPPGVKAASAINLLQEADDTRIGPGIYAMEEALGVAGTMLLEIVAKYWTEGRMIMIVGENNAIDNMEFRGAMLKENTQVEVRSGSSLPQSKAARQAAMQDMLSLAFQYEAGQAMKPRFLAKALKDFEAGGLEKLFGDLSQDESQINRENQKMSEGEGQEVHVYDEHKVHIEGHTEYQRTASYEHLDPVTKKVFEMHVQAHRLALMQAMAPPAEEQHEQSVETQPPEPPKESK